MTTHSDSVPSARAGELIETVLQPLISDMQRVRPGEWARPLTDEVRAVVRLSPLKGGQYDVVYGTCYAWVPVPRGRRPGYEWPQSMGHTRLHLWVDHFTLDAELRQWISTHVGERLLRRQTQVALQQVLDRAPAWWASVATPEGALAEAQRQAAHSFPNRASS